jgi:endonuclease/exonuclease/phosphatase family metal-dependent hydrolase
VLSYNTRGLPAWVALDDPAGRSRAIGALTNRYAVTLLQEDFAHHAALRSRARQPEVRRGNDSQSPRCPWCNGSGLALLLGKGLLAKLVNRAYESCHGLLLSGADCLASKGYQIARVVLESGAIVHLANTHLDAGRGERDRAVRARQLEALRHGIEANVGQGALVVAGDFNLDAAVPEDAALLRAFRRGLGLADSGARPAPGSAWRVLDYVLYRGGEGARLRVLEAGEDRNFARDGAPLSDHPAIFARFGVRAR